METVKNDGAENNEQPQETNPITAPNTIGLPVEDKPINTPEITGEDSVNETPAPGTGIDLNGDGKADEVTTDNEGKETVAITPPSNESEQPLSNTGNAGGVIAPTPDVNLPETTPAPGTGIDLDGDGNAEEVTTTTDSDIESEPTHIDCPEDYEGKVKLSGNMGDVMEKDKAEELVTTSGISQHNKDIMLTQIKAGQLYRPYGEVLKKLSKADSDGTIYRPGTNGL